MLVPGMHVKQADADANTLIISTSLDVAASEGRQVIVVGTDTD